MCNKNYAEFATRWLIGIETPSGKPKKFVCKDVVVVDDDYNEYAIPTLNAKLSHHHIAEFVLSKSNGFSSLVQTDVLYI